MTGEVILVILSLAGVIIAQTNCPTRGMNGSCTHFHATCRFVKPLQILLQRHIHHAWL